MKLYNVIITDSFNASYEGRIDTSYTRLVFANTGETAIKFVNKELRTWHGNTGFATKAIGVDSNKSDLVRKTQFYKNTI